MKAPSERSPLKGILRPSVDAGTTGGCSASCASASIDACVTGAFVAASTTLTFTVLEVSNSLWTKRGVSTLMPVASVSALIISAVVARCVLVFCCRRRRVTFRDHLSGVTVYACEVLQLLIGILLGVLIIAIGVLSARALRGRHLDDVMPTRNGCPFLSDPHGFRARPHAKFLWIIA